jgi:hypothetical protein
MNEKTRLPPERPARARRALWSTPVVLALAACASSPPPVPPTPVQVCADGRCGPAAERFSADQLAQRVGQMLAAHDGQRLALCEADPRTRECIGDDLGYFVLGGLLPGRGSADAARMSQVRFDPAARAVRYVMSMSMRFLGIGLSCADHDAALTVHSTDAVEIVDRDHRCTWMVVGIMNASFRLTVDSIDFDRGRIAGHWQHRVAGTGNGRGAGYAVIGLPPSAEAAAQRGTATASAR